MSHSNNSAVYTRVIGFPNKPSETKSDYSRDLNALELCF